ncbi:MAG TPA: TonB-dependent receptor [Saprospiraceae bacterium]|nr:TonB-dependent receptor [Saprospiraceae bacterium]
MQAQQDTSGRRIAPDSIMMHVETHPVLLYATRNRLPYAISQINDDAIARLNEPLIEPLLNSTPGLWMQSGTLNTNRISLRGVGYREPFATTGIKVYLDEIPLTNGVGEASVEDIHPNILSGIEILRGPSSALWGAGLGGMILLKSEMPHENTWRARIQGGSYGRLQADQQLSLRYGHRDQWGTVLHYQYLNDDGYRDNNQYRKYSMTWMQHWHNKQGWTIQSFLHAIALKAFIPSSITVSDYESHPQIAAPTWAMVMGNEDYKKWISGLTFGYASQKNFIYRGSVFGTWFSSDEVRPFNVLDEKNRAYGTRQRMAWQIHRAGHVTAGLEYYRERYEAATFETLPGGIKGTQLSADRDRRSYLHVFCQSEWNIMKHGNIFAGLSSAWSRLSDDLISANVPASVFPTAGMHYALTPFLSVSASLSRGYTALSLSDVLNSDGSIQSDITPETGWNKEVSIAVNKNENLLIKMTAYIMQVRNTIITRRIMDDQFEKLNSGQTIHRGIEVETRIKGIDDRWSWSAAYTFNDHIFSEFEDNGTDYSGKSLPGIPRHRLYQRLSFKPTIPVTVSFIHHRVSVVYLNDLNALRGNGYHLINTSIEYVFRTSGEWCLTLGAYVHNIFDTHYSPMFQINAPGAMPRYYYPGKPRSVYVSVGVQHGL